VFHGGLEADIDILSRNHQESPPDAITSAAVDGNDQAVIHLHMRRGAVSYLSTFEGTNNHDNSTRMPHHVESVDEH
jgi:hypothetical protein